MKPKTKTINEYLVFTDCFEAILRNNEANIAYKDKDEYYPDYPITIPESKLTEVMEVLKTLSNLIKKGRSQTTKARSVRTTKGSKK